MSFRQVILSSYAGLRGAVGLALALIVDADPKVDTYVKDVVLYHVASLATLTLLINAPTTGLLVKKLKLIEKTDV
jgi:NhaP-type Na+/H+ or K+/H+ antiporter